MLRPKSQNKNYGFANRQQAYLPKKYERFLHPSKFYKMIKQSEHKRNSSVYSLRSTNKNRNFQINNKVVNIKRNLFSDLGQMSLQKKGKDQQKKYNLSLRSLSSLNQSQKKSRLSTKSSSSFRKNKLYQHFYEQQNRGKGGLNLNEQKNMSRLQKIMNIKVEKPTVCSTLKNYQPIRKDPPTTKNQGIIKFSSLIDMLKCKRNLEKRKSLEEKQNILWKTFERERQSRYKEKVRKDQEKYNEERRIQNRFQKAIQKQIHKIQQNRQIKLRKQHGFSQYLYPSY